MNHFSYSVRHRNGWGTGFGPRPTHCATCAQPLPVPAAGSGSTGYGCSDEEPIASHPAAPVLKKGESLTRSKAHCYKCCAAAEEARMIETGRATLYLTREQPDPAGAPQWYATDWPGGIRLHCFVRRSRNNFGAERMDAWFTHKGRRWHGVNVGDNQILRCRRLKHD